MSRVCEVTGKKGLNGNRVSHVNNKSPHVQRPNLKKKRVFVPELKRWVVVRLSAKGIKVLDKKGPYRALKEAGLL